MMPRPYQKHRKPSLALWLSVLAAIALTLASCQRPASQPGGPPGASGPAVLEDFKIEVSIDHLPKLNEPFTVTGKFTPIKKDEEDAELWIGVVSLASPWGIYLDGEDRWHGPLKLGETKTLAAIFAVVAEGNYDAGAAAYSTARTGQEAIPVHFTVTAESSSFGWKDNSQSGISIAAKGEVPVGRNVVVDSALLLNTSPFHRVEFIQSKDDIVRLQAEGLLPKELRYSWRELLRFDFSKVFLIAYFDAMKSTPGYLPVFQGHNLIWDNGTLRGSYKAYSVPPWVTRAIRPVSSAVIKLLSWEVQPFQVQEKAFQGARTFEFAVDGGPSIVKTVKLRPGPAPTPAPPPSPLPGPAYNQEDPRTLGLSNATITIEEP